MLMTRALYIILFLVNLVVNGLALLHLTAVFPTDAQIVPGALLFNLVLLPVALFAAYRTGGMTEEIYRQNEQAVVAAANAQQAKAAAASPTHDVPAKSPSETKPNAATKSQGDAPEPQRQKKADAAARPGGPEAASSTQSSSHDRKA